MRRLFAPALLALLGLHCLVPLRAGAETGEVSLAGQYGLPYLPFMVMEHEKLIEACRRAAQQSDGYEDYAAALLAVPRAAFACPVCFGQSDSPLASATNRRPISSSSLCGARANVRRYSSRIRVSTSVSGIDASSGRFANRRACSSASGEFIK